MEDWGAVKARLQVAAGTHSGHYAPKLWADIRAALDRADHIEAGYHRRKDELDEQYREILALRQRVNDLEWEVNRLSQCGEHHPERGEGCYCAACWQARCIIEMDRALAAQGRVAELERDYAEVQDISVQEKLRAEAAEAKVKELQEKLDASS